jgi:hypothetical protein
MADLLDDDSFARDLELHAIRTRAWMGRGSSSNCCAAAGVKTTVAMMRPHPNED